jgi:hypothetical protein
MLYKLFDNTWHIARKQAGFSLVINENKLLNFPDLEREAMDRKRRKFENEIALELSGYSYADVTTKTVPKNSTFPYDIQETTAYGYSAVDLDSEKELLGLISWLCKKKELEEIKKLLEKKEI